MATGSSIVGEPELRAVQGGEKERSSFPIKMHSTALDENICVTFSVAPVGWQTILSVCSLLVPLTTR